MVASLADADAADRRLLAQLLSRCFAQQAAAAEQGQPDARTSGGLGREAVLEALLAVLGHGSEPAVQDGDGDQIMAVEAPEDVARSGSEASVSALTAEVAAAAERVALLRERVPRAVSEAVAAEAKAWRPVLHAADMVLTATNLTPGKLPQRSSAGGCATPPPAGPTPAIARPADACSQPSSAAQLHVSLLQALDRLHNLRARMEEASKRMGNILQAVEDQQSLETGQLLSGKSYTTSPFKLSQSQGSDWVVRIVAAEAQP